MPSTPTALIAIRVDEEANSPVSDELAAFLSPLPITLVGLYSVPDQTAPAQARDQFESDARDRLKTVAKSFDQTGAELERRIAFTHDPNATLATIANDIDRLAIVFPAPMTVPDRILVAARGEINVSNLASTAKTLLKGSNANVTLYHALDTSDEVDVDTDEGDRALQAIETTLREGGIAAERITTTVERADDPLDALIEQAEAHDFLIIGEDQPQLADRIFGETYERIADAVSVPLLVVRRPEQ